MEPAWFSFNRKRYVLFIILSVLLTLIACIDIKEETSSLSINSTSMETAETAREKALCYVSSKYSIPRESLIVYSQESIMPDPFFKEEVELIMIGDKQHVIAKVVVDSDENVMEFREYNEYLKATKQTGRDIFGNINPGLYNYLQNKEPDDMVKVKIIISNNSEVVTYIESQGFKITDIGNLPNNGLLVYSELPKYFILELAKRADVNDIELDTPAFPP